MCLALLAACASIPQKMDYAQGASCADVTEESDAILADDSYPAQPEPARAAYEMRVASCFLEQGKVPRALAIARAWPEDRQTSKLKIEARASARQADEKAARAKLAELARLGELDPYYLLDNDEFRTLAERDWFPALALYAWTVQRRPRLPTFTSRLMAFLRTEPLAFSTAFADPNHPPGQWASWTGIVRDRRLDAASNRTILMVEEAAPKDDLYAAEGRGADVTSSFATVATAAWPDLLPSTGVSFRDGMKVYQEEFVPSGRTFVLRFAGLDKHVAAMQAVTAIGRFAGRTKDGAYPILDAEMVLERHPK